MKAKILIVDDEADIRNLIQAILRDEGYATLTASNAKEAYAQIAGERPDLVVLDIWLQGSHQDGLEILKTIKAESPHIQVIMISGHGTIETAVKAIKDGAYDFIEKPFKSDRLVLMIRRAIETMNLIRENEKLRRNLGPPPQLTGNSRAIRAPEKTLRESASTRRNIHLFGQHGSGKELAARLFSHFLPEGSHDLIVLSARHTDPESLGKTLSRAGLSCVLVDDIAALSAEGCAALCRAFVQDKKPPGQGLSGDLRAPLIFTSTREPSDVALLSEDHVRLLKAANPHPIAVPSLRERREDIPALIELFLNALGKQLGGEVPSFTPEAMRCLQDYSWPGNIRQLKSVVESTVLSLVHTNKETCDIAHLPPLLLPLAQRAQSPEDGRSQGIDVRPVSDLPLREAREIFECAYLLSRIERFGGNISKTAQFVGMERSALHRKIKGLTTEEGREPRMMSALSESSTVMSASDPVSETSRKRA